MPKLRSSPEEKAMRRFNGFVRDGMSRHNLNQDDIADELGISRSSVSKRLKCKYRWTLEEAIKICILFEEDYAVIGGIK